MIPLSGFLEGLEVQGPPHPGLRLLRETRSADNQLSARLFLPGEEEALEDPASGAAAACLGACLSVQGGLEPAGGELRIEQGFEMGRPSLLRLRAGRHGVLEVGGEVRPAPAGSA